MTQILLDSSFLVELLNARGAKHRRTVEALVSQPAIRVIPDVVLTEVTYLLRSRIGQRAVYQFLNSLADDRIQLETLTKPDTQRVRQIMMQYEDADLDFVDCCIMAISERLNITTVYTFDQRDFTIFRPKHCEFLELLP
ncbi:MAG: PIN domain-containing protein [Anaerolineae bacterium]|nr:PIN domain-containing protein [Anaerolineae bacterium]